MTDIFYSPKLTLRRAEFHVQDFKAKIATAIHGDSYRSYVIEPDANGITEAHKIKFRKEFFEDLSCIVFDIANNLRSTLDQTAYQVGLRYRGAPPKSAKFPFGDTRINMVNQAKGQTDLPIEIRTLFQSFKPYKGGHISLWTVNELANHAKHFALMPVMADSQYIGITIGGMTIFNKDTWDPEKYELELSRQPIGTKPHHKIKPALNIAFDHPNPQIASILPIPFFDGLPSVFERILLATEAECRRIGLIA